MQSIIAILGIPLIVGIIFVIAHLRPLTEKEIIQLSTQRRSKKLHSYFAFNSNEFNIDREFKKQMSPIGKLYQINEKLSVFPPIAAALLKYKKHEWIIIAFEKEGHIITIWLNKGISRAEVYSFLTVSDIIKIAESNHCASVLIFHNHPNADPGHFDCRRPSGKDMQSAQAIAGALNRSGLNLLEFVCERGRHYIYYLSCADTFLALSEFSAILNGINNRSKLGNLLLHIERLFR